jgi:hypothetical protein
MICCRSAAHLPRDRQEHPEISHQSKDLGAFCRVAAAAAATKTTQYLDRLQHPIDTRQTTNYFRPGFHACFHVLASFQLEPSKKFPRA